MVASDSVQKLLDEWYYRVSESQASHYAAARHYRNLHYYIGIPAVILSGVIGTSVFASLGKQASPTYTILIGLMSVLVAVLTSLQTFLRFSERADKHRIAGARYGAIRREIEQASAVPANISLSEEQFLTNLRQRIDSLAVESSDVSLRVWFISRAERKVIESKKPPKDKD